jgi:hypothetical protein
MDELTSFVGIGTDRFVFSPSDADPVAQMEAFAADVASAVRRRSRGITLMPYDEELAERIHVDPERSDRIVVTSYARPMEMRGRQVQGWLRVAPEELRTKRELARWGALGSSYARSLPTKS